MVRPVPLLHQVARPPALAVALAQANLVAAVARTLRSLRCILTNGVYLQGHPMNEFMHALMLHH